MNSSSKEKTPTRFSKLGALAGAVLMTSGAVYFSREAQKEQETMLALEQLHHVQLCTRGESRTQASESNVQKINMWALNTAQERNKKIREELTALFLKKTKRECLLAELEISADTLAYSETELAGENVTTTKERNNFGDARALVDQAVQEKRDLERLMQET